MVNSPTFDQRLQSAFDEWAPTYEADASGKIAARGYSYAELGRAVASACEISSSRPVLEVGVGTGILGVEVASAREGVVLHGIDISPGMLKLAAKCGVYERLDCSPADAFDYSTGYSVVYSSFAFHSVRDQPEFLRRVATGLETGGQLIIVDLFPSAPMDADARRVHAEEFEKGAPSNYLDEAEFHSMVMDLGYSVVNHHRLGERREFDHAWYQLTIG